MTQRTQASEEKGIFARTHDGTLLLDEIERAVALARFDQIAVDDLPDNVRDHRSSHVVVSSDNPSDLVSLEEVERRHVRRVMEIVGGNKSAGARILGLDRKRLHRMLARLGL